MFRRIGLCYPRPPDPESGAARTDPGTGGPGSFSITFQLTVCRMCRQQTLFRNPMKRILVIFFTPGAAEFLANKQLLHAIEGLEDHLHDLCQRYPDMFINVKREQALLAEHDIIVFQHPFYWYSCPAIMKEWMDLVLEYGYAYGPEAHALNGKQWLSAITTGAAPNPTAALATNQRPLLDFLLFPADRTAVRHALAAPFVLHSFHKLEDP